MITAFRSFSRPEVEAFAARYDADATAQHIAAELLHLREQRDALQARCSELVLAERAARGVLSLCWKRIGDHGLPVPERAHDTDAGLDLAVVVPPSGYPGHVPPGAAGLSPTPDRLVLFRTGWAVAIPPGWFGLIVVRSSIGKAGWDIESSGVIDSSYRGELMLPMVYRGEPFDERRFVKHGQRMAQMLVLPVPRVESTEVGELDQTARGAGGFGSTGV